MTANSDIEVVIQAFNELQIYHYALKPWNNQDLRIIIENALKQYFLSVENNRLLRELQVANELLEQKVAQRTLELQRRNEEYEQLNELKDKLLALVSHDVRAPLATLAGFTQIFFNDFNNFSPKETRIIMTDIQRSSANVQNMLDSVLYWTRNQLQSPHPVLLAYSVKDLIQQNIELLQPIADQKNISIQDGTTDETIEVIADEGMIHMVLRNLISNAIKYTPANGHIRISATYNQRQVVIAVSDTGTGMTQEMVARVLTKQWIDSIPGTSNEKGTGLGLNLCQEYLEKQGSKLSIQTTLGRGSTFSFSLPYVWVRPSLAC